MKKILNSVILVSLLGLFFVACENATGPADQGANNDLALSKQSGKSSIPLQ